MKELGTALAQQLKSQPEMLLLYAVIAFTALTVVIIALCITVVILARKQSRLLRGTDGGNLEAALIRQMDAADEIERRVEQTLQLGQGTANDVRACLQRISVVRFDAFPDIGGEQSFSIALLDAGGNGLLLTGIHSRHDLRVYAKPVIANDSPVALTEEERKAIATATSASMMPLTVGRGGKERK